MKKVLFPILAAVLMLGLALPTASVVASPGPGIVGLWHLDEGSGTTASDSSVNANHGTLKPTGSEPNWVSGKFGNALDFDGSDDYVLVKDDLSLNPSGSMTIEAWFKTTDASGGMIVNKDGVSSNRQYDIHLNADGGLATNFWSPKRAHVNTKEIGILTNYNNGIWHYVAATFNAGDRRVRLYVDGVLVGRSHEKIPSVTLTAEDVWIGNRQNSALPFDGLIDEVRIWDEARTAEQVAQSYALHVDDDNCPGPGTGTQENPFCTIQLAVNAADPGDIIIVHQGTYNLTSPIVVDRSLTITGDTATPSNVTVDAGTITGYDRDCFQVKASGVTIQGFKIQGAIDTSGGQNNGVTIGAWWNGAAIVGLQNIVITYNEITNCSKGISVYRAQHITISHNKIHDCPTGTEKPGSWPGKGIMLYGDGSGIQNYDIDILNNEIYNNGLFGIELNHWATATGAWIDVDVLIDGNTIYNNGGPFDDVGYPVDCGRGISANGHETGVTITNNEVYGHWSTSGVRFHHTAAGIRANDSKGFVVNNNNVHDNMRGIYIYGSDTTFGDENTGFIVNRNDVHDNAQGIVFGDGDVGEAHSNNIYNNNVTTYTGDGVGPCGVVNLGTYILNARANWWGDASGPSGAGPGTGDAVTANVLYKPWKKKALP